MGRYIITEEQKLEIIERYRNYEDIYDIAESFFMNVTTLQSRLKEWGVSRKRDKHNRTFCGISK